MKSFILLSVVVGIVLCSCNKELGPVSGTGNNDSTGNNNNNNRLVRITQGVAEDTSYTIQYINDKPVKMVLGGTALGGTDTMYISYDVAGNVAGIIEKYNATSTSQDLTYSYSAGGLLTAIQGMDFGGRNKYSFEYDADNRLTKKSFYDDVGMGGALVLYRYFTYTFNSDGDIAEMNEYNSAGTLVNTTTYTYTSYPVGPLKLYALINNGNILGFSDILNIDYFFNVHLTATATNNNGVRQISYTTDASGNITRAISEEGIVYTHNFYYE